MASWSAAGPNAATVGVSGQFARRTRQQYWSDLYISRLSDSVPKQWKMRQEVSRFAFWSLVVRCLSKSHHCIMTKMQACDRHSRGPRHFRPILHLVRCRLKAQTLLRPRREDADLLGPTAQAAVFIYLSKLTSGLSKVGSLERS